MKQESSEGCPRCDDYNEVVEELKKEKENKDREVKSQLQKCEERHKKKDTKIKGMEKKILTMTIIAVVAGTVLGKDFIDEIASYFKSFNDVADNASKLIGSADLPEQPKELAKNDNEDSTEEFDDAFVLVPAPREIDMSSWTSLIAMADLNNDIIQPYYGNSILDSLVDSQNQSLTSLILETTLESFEPEMSMMNMSSLSDIYSMTSFGEVITVPFIDFDFGIDEPVAFTSLPPAVVPETSSFMPLCMATVMCRTRRKRK